MKLVHSLVVTPGHCGLYESAKDMIVAEEKLGHEVVVIEPLKASKGMKDDDLAVATDDQRTTFLAGADVLIDHSGCDAQMLASGLPIIHLRHSVPYRTFLESMDGELDVYTHCRTMGADKRYKAFATFWDEHVPYWEAVIARQVHLLPAPVDLPRITPDGHKHDFGDKAGKINVVLADMWRRVVPFEQIEQFRRFAIDNPGARLHVFGIKESCDAINTLLKTLGDTLGQAGYAKNMPAVYRAADFAITKSTIATRVRREALACGCPCVSQFPATMNHLFPTRAGARIQADQYDSNRTAKALLEICEQVAGACV